MFRSGWIVLFGDPLTFTLEPSSFQWLNVIKYSMTKGGDTHYNCWADYECDLGVASDLTKSDWVTHLRFPLWVSLHCPHLSIQDLNQTLCFVPSYFLLFSTNCPAYEQFKLLVAVYGLVQEHATVGLQTSHGCSIWEIIIVEKYTINHLKFIFYSFCLRQQCVLKSVKCVLHMDCHRKNMQRYTQESLKPVHFPLKNIWRACLSAWASLRTPEVM